MRLVSPDGSSDSAQSLSLPLLGAKPILVYVDHTSRFDRNTGIQRCVRSLSRAWISLGALLQPVTWDRESKQLIPASSSACRHLARWGGPPPTAWLDNQSLVQADWLYVAELVCGPHNPTAVELRQESLRLRIKLAWLFHDAIPVRWAHLYGAQALQASRSHAKYMNGLADFELVLANSYTTASHLREHWQEENLNPRGVLRALPLATELPSQERCCAPSGSESLVLCVASLEPRKNHLGLLKAFASLVAQGLWHPSYTLVLVGWANDARIVQLVERATTLELPLRWEYQADDERLHHLYEQAAFCVYPSLDEGFGLPVAESLWHRRPCLCSGSGALGELASDGGCYTVDTSDWRALRQGLNRLVHDLDLRRHLQVQIGQRRPRLWREVACEWLLHAEAADK